MKHEKDLTGTRTCPRCLRKYSEVPALSRTDNETLICPECGTREALESLGLGRDEQEEILAVIRRYSKGHS